MNNRNSFIAKNFNNIIRDICKEHSFNLIELCNNYLKIIEADNKSYCIWGHDFGLNKSSSANIAKDKVATSNILDYYNIPCIKHVLPEDINKLDSNSTYVIKPITGHNGNNIYFCNNIPKDLDRMCISNYIDYEREYRVVMLYNKNVVSFYKKKNAITRLHNLSKGAKAYIDFRHDISELAITTADKLDLNFCSIDIADTVNGLKVVEVNTMVTLEKYLEYFPSEYINIKNLYRDVIKYMMK